MADKYIDQDETRIYGRHASQNIRQRRIGQIAAFDSALFFIADQIDTAVGIHR